MNKFFLLSLPLVSLLTFALSGEANAQDTTRVENPTLQYQYSDMLRKSRNMDGYKLVNPNRLNNFWRSANDTLRKERRMLSEAQAKLNTLSSSVGTLKNSLSSNEQALAESTAKLNQVSFLGVPIEKSTYNLIMWGAVLILGIALLVTIFQSLGARKEARYRTQLFEELTNEFQTYKVKANEREKKLARELQDERNKLDDLGQGHRG